ncbi:MAG TPA: hypothetical protein VJ695_02880 [Nitrososphaera sp.]|nr:hypothetical protein [Nitrososphaera sp.]
MANNYIRIVLTTEKAEWKTFCNALDKSEKKDFDEMWDIAKNYMSACSNAVQLVPLHPIVISILFHHYKELKQCIMEVEQMALAPSYRSEQRIDLKEEEPVSFDNYIVSNS